MHLTVNQAYLGSIPRAGAMVDVRENSNFLFYALPPLCIGGEPWQNHDCWHGMVV